MANSCCKEDDLDEIIPCKLSNDGLALATVVNERGTTEVMKGWIKYLVDAG